MRREASETPLGRGDGAAWQSAETSLHNGEKLLNLYSGVPLWPDLEIGIEGDDVVALNEELRRLGYETSGDDMFRRGDLNSFRALLNAAGMKADVESVQASSIVWLPSPKIMISRCEAGLGSRVAVDDTFVSSQSGVSAKVLADISSESAPRNLQVGE
jgi:hypothetical protein